MDRKSKQSSTLNSDKKCDLSIAALSWEGGTLGGIFSEADLLSTVSGRVLEESTIGDGDDFGTLGGLVIRCGSSCILIVALLFVIVRNQGDRA
jgi:hypothetical protein